MLPFFIWCQGNQKEREHKRGVIMNLLDASAENLLAQYRLSLEVANRSPKTISWYLPILRRFFGFLKEKGYSIDITKIGRDELRAYIKYLQETERWANKPGNGKNRGKMSAYSIQGHTRALKAYWSWLVREGYIKINPLENIPLPKVPQYVIRTLTCEQINKLLSAIDKSTPLGFKYYCIILLLVDTGMRISELVNIKVSDVDIRRGFVTIFGKGQKQRVVPVSRITVRELLRYLDRFRQSNEYTDSPYLFPDNYGGSVTVNSIQQYLRRLAQKVGIEDVKVTPHIFRHTFATNAAAQGVNAFILKEIMGHSSMQTTMRYVHPQPDDLKVQHEVFSMVKDLFKKK